MMRSTLERQRVDASARLSGITGRVSGPLRLASIIGLAASMIWLAQAWLVATVFSALITGTEPAEDLVLPVAAFAVLGVLRALLRHRADGLLFQTAELTLMRERRELVERESRRSAFAPAAGSGEIAALASDKIAALGPYLTRYAPAMMRVRVVPLVILAIAFSMSWAVGLVFMMTGPLIPVFMALVGLAAREASEKQMQEIGSLNALLLERLRAITDIRLLDASGTTVESLASGAEALRARTMAVLRIAFLSSTVLELFAAIGVALVAVYVGFALLGVITFGAYATPLTVFEGIFLLLLAPEFYQPMRDLAAAWHDKAAALAVADELAELEGGKHEMILGLGVQEPRKHQPATISTSGVVHITPAGRTIRFPDLVIRAGERVALTGPSGAGKSTLLAILAGLIGPQDGLMVIGGVTMDDPCEGGPDFSDAGPQVIDLTDPDGGSSAHADKIRAEMAWIAQTPHFLNASLRANLLLGQPDGGDPATLPGALKAAAAEDIVARLPRGLDTRIGETGHGVSGGEARRLMIARALAADPAIVLADEPTADLDAETAETITKGLLELAARGATLIVATHDRALAARMDRIIEIGAEI